MITNERVFAYGRHNIVRYRKLVPVGAYMYLEIANFMSIKDRP